LPAQLFTTNPTWTNTSVNVSQSGKNPAANQQSYAAAKLLDNFHKQNIQMGRQLGITSPSNGVPWAYTSDYGFCKLFQPVRCNKTTTLLYSWYCFCVIGIHCFFFSARLCYVPYVSHKLVSSCRLLAFLLPTLFVYTFISQ